MTNLFTINMYKMQEFSSHFGRKSTTQQFSHNSNTQNQQIQTQISPRNQKTTKKKTTWIKANQFSKCTTFNCFLFMLANSIHLNHLSLSSIQTFPIKSFLFYLSLMSSIITATTTETKATIVSSLVKDEMRRWTQK